jgi:hypothetical protein
MELTPKAPQRFSATENSDEMLSKAQTNCTGTMRAF